MREPPRQFRGRDYFLPETACPECHEVLDAASNMPGSRAGRPSPGCLSVCVMCAAVLEFDQSMRLIPARATTLMNYRLCAPEELRKVENAVALLMDERAKRSRRFS